jgi:CO/xanthine dehydrogenase FAD-binding subunit
LGTAWYAPKTLEELQQTLRRMTPDSRILGGGSDLVIRMRQESFEPDALLYTGEVAEFRSIVIGEHALIIGAAATMDEIIQAGLGSGFGALPDAALGIGSVQIRHTATIGGNIATASPAADLLPPLFLFGAEVEIVSPGGLVRRPIDEVVVGAGKTTLRYDECLARIIVPTCGPAGFRSTFAKLGFRKKVTISRIGIAVGLVLDEHRVATCAKVVVGAIAPTPVRIPKAEEALLGHPLTDDVKTRVGDAVSDVIRSITNRAYKIGAARGVAADALDRFSSFQPPRRAS